MIDDVIVDNIEGDIDPDDVLVTDNEVETVLVNKFVIVVDILDVLVLEDDFVKVPDELGVLELVDELVKVDDKVDVLELVVELVTVDVCDSELLDDNEYDGVPVGESDGDDVIDPLDDDE